MNKGISVVNWWEGSLICPTGRANDGRLEGSFSFLCCSSDDRFYLIIPNFKIETYDVLKCPFD